MRRCRPPLPPLPRRARLIGALARRECTEQREKGSGASREGADHAGETPEQALHAGQGAGKREHPAATLRWQGRLEMRCREGRCLEQERMDERIGLDERFF